MRRGFGHRVGNWCGKVIWWTFVVVCGAHLLASLVGH